jgi:hypothetical protein
VSSVGMRLGAMVAVGASLVALGLGVAPANAAAPAAAVVQHGRLMPRDTYTTEIDADGVRLHSGAGSGSVVGLLYSGDSVEVLTTDGSWARLYLTSDSSGGLPAGSAGWVWDGYLACAPSSPTGGVCG